MDLENILEKNLRYKLYCKILKADDDLIFEKEGHRYQLMNTVCEESDLIIQDLEATAKRKHALDQILAVVSRDSTVAYYKVKAGFIGDENGLEKIPYDLKKETEEEQDEEEEDQVLEED